MSNTEKVNEALAELRKRFPGEPVSVQFYDYTGIEGCEGSGYVTVVGGTARGSGVTLDEAMAEIKKVNATSPATGQEGECDLFNKRGFHDWRYFGWPLTNPSCTEQWCAVCALRQVPVRVEGKVVWQDAGRKEDKGCLCQYCGTEYKVDCNIPDALWEAIRGNKNLLCGSCIAKRIEHLGQFDSFTLTRCTFPTVAEAADSIPFNALLKVLERLKSKNRNPERDWYLGWNAALDCLISDINARSAAQAEAKEGAPVCPVTRAPHHWKGATDIRDIVYVAAVAVLCDPSVASGQLDSDEANNLATQIADDVLTDLIRKDGDKNEQGEDAGLSHSQTAIVKDNTLDAAPGRECPCRGTGDEWRYDCEDCFGTGLLPFVHYAADATGRPCCIEPDPVTSKDGAQVTCPHCLSVVHQRQNMDMGDWLK